MEKEIIPVLKIVSGTSTNAEAIPLFHEMDKVIAQGKIIVLSLKDCRSFSSSFLNSSVGALFEKYGFDALKGRLSLRDYTPSIAEAFKRYLDNLHQIKS